MTHTEYIIAQLRDTASRGVSSWGDLQQAAADELERLVQPVQEPVAYQWLDTGTFRKRLPSSAEPGAWRALYTTPPLPVQPAAQAGGLNRSQACLPWIGLTDEQINQTINKVLAATAPRVGYFDIAIAIQAKLKERNE